MPAPRRPLIGRQIVAQFGDGKWHMVDDIAAAIGAELDHVAATLRGIQANQTYSCRAEFKNVGTKVAYRIFKLDNPISRTELIAKLTPIVEALRVEGRKNIVTASPAAVAVLAGQLAKLLDGWTERPHPHGTRGIKADPKSPSKETCHETSTADYNGAAGVPAGVVRNGGPHAGAGEKVQGDDAQPDRKVVERVEGEAPRRES